MLTIACLVRLRYYKTTFLLFAIHQLLYSTLDRELRIETVRGIH